MSILPARTSPHRSLEETPREVSESPAGLPIMVEMAWRALRPIPTAAGDDAPNGAVAYAPSMIRGRLHADGIEVELRDEEEPTGLRMIPCRTSSAIVERDGRCIRIIRWSTDADESLVRIAVEAGRPPAVRTKLPTRLGLPGGTYDLLSVTIED